MHKRRIYVAGVEAGASNIRVSLIRCRKMELDIEGTWGSCVVDEKGASRWTDNVFEFWVIHYMIKVHYTEITLQDFYKVAKK